MMSKLSNSWHLFKASLSVLQADKELMIFPLVSFAGLVGTMVVFFAPMAFFGFGSSMDDETMKIAGTVVGFAFYVVSSFVMFYFNSALVGAALIRLDGGDPTVADGLRIARQNIGNIFGYAVITATVGMLLRALRERSGALGNIAASLLGVAWNLASYLAVPILVSRGLGPIEALKESGRMLKKTWGEQIAGNLGLGMIFGLAYVATGILVIPLVIFAATTGSGFAIAGALVVAILAVAGVALLHVTLNGIYSAALYRYATTGEAGMLDQQLLANAFR